MDGVLARKAALEQADRFGIVPPWPEMAVRYLSGGNQQKVLLAKWMLAAPRVLALHEPTRGVDVGAKREIFAHLSAAAEAGAVVLLSTVEHEDLVHCAGGCTCSAAELAPASCPRAS